MDLRRVHAVGNDVSRVGDRTRTRVDGHDGAGHGRVGQRHEQRAPLAVADQARRRAIGQADLLTGDAATEVEEVDRAAPPHRGEEVLALHGELVGLERQVDAPELLFGKRVDRRELRLLWQGDDQGHAVGEHGPAADLRQGDRRLGFLRRLGAHRQPDTQRSRGQDANPQADRRPFSARCTPGSAPEKRHGPGHGKRSNSRGRAAVPSLEVTVSRTPILSNAQGCRPSRQPTLQGGILLTSGSANACGEDLSRHDGLFTIGSQVNPSRIS